MINFHEALSIVRERTPAPSEPPVAVPVTDACGRVLARDVMSTVDLPPFNKAAMDGFAIRAADLATTPTELEVVLEVRAGATPEGSVGAGQAARPFMDRDLDIRFQASAKNYSRPDNQEVRLEGKISTLVRRPEGRKRL